RSPRWSSAEPACSEVEEACWVRRLGSLSPPCSRAGSSSWAFRRTGRTLRLASFSSPRSLSIRQDDNLGAASRHATPQGRTTPFAKQALERGAVALEQSKREGSEHEETMALDSRQHCGACVRLHCGASGM